MDAPETSGALSAAGGRVLFLIATRSESALPSAERAVRDTSGGRREDENFLQIIGNLVLLLCRLPRRFSHAA